VEGHGSVQNRVLRILFCSDGGRGGNRRLEVIAHTHTHIYIYIYILLMSNCVRLKRSRTMRRVGHVARKKQVCIQNLGGKA
jgi:hypothetical protein